MIQSYYDIKYNAVIVEFKGCITAAHVKDLQVQVKKIIPKKPGFRFLTDYTLMESMDENVLGIIKENMDYLNSLGVSEIIRVFPNPEKDIGFNILSIFHYSKKVRWVILQSREEANARLEASLK